MWVWVGGRGARQHSKGAVQADGFIPHGCVRDTLFAIHRIVHTRLHRVRISLAHHRAPELVQSGDLALDARAASELDVSTQDLQPNQRGRCAAPNHSVARNVGTAPVRDPAIEESAKWCGSGRVLQHVVLCCSTLCCVAARCAVLQHVVLCCSTLCGVARHVVRCCTAWLHDTRYTRHSIH